MLFYYTNDESLLSYYIHIFLKNHPSCESIDASLYTSEDINQKISQINLFENQHNFLFHHFNILKQKTFINIEEDSSVFFILCDKPNPFLLQNGKLLKPFGRTDFVKLIDSLLKDKKVQNEQVYDLIIENSNKNPLVIQNNIYSLYYYDDKKEITEEMVNCIFQKPSNDNIFSFLSHILFCDFQKTFSSLNQFALLKINGINIINAISSNLFTLKIIKMCNCDDISSLSLILKTPLWKINKLHEIAKKFDKNHIESLLSFFYEFDYNIKKGEKEPTIGFKVLLLNYYGQSNNNLAN